jgi:hypothetical protein
MLDFTRAALAARAEPVPAGAYDLRIASAEASTSGGGHTSLALAGEIVDGPHRGRKVADGLMLASVDERRLAGLIRRGLQLTAQLLDAVEATEAEREAAGADLVRLGRLLAGRIVRVTTGVTTDARDGTRREIIVKVQPSPLDEPVQVIG